MEQGPDAGLPAIVRLRVSIAQLIETVSITVDNQYVAVAAKSRAISLLPLNRGVRRHRVRTRVALVSICGKNYRYFGLTASHDYVRDADWGSVVKT
jgi:hypothetical protein